MRVVELESGFRDEIGLGVAPTPETAFARFQHINLSVALDVKTIAISSNRNLSHNYSYDITA